MDSKYIVYSLQWHFVWMDTSVVWILKSVLIIKEVASLYTFKIIIRLTTYFCWLNIVVLGWWYRQISLQGG